jgi:PadR family transcriptional regulator, regulatory protein PadR
MERLPEVELLTLLAVARIGDGAYGVAILDEIRTSAGMEPSVAAVYAALERLDRHGLIRVSLSDPVPERGGRARREYRLTPIGRSRLRRERAAAMRIWRLKAVEDDSSVW